MWLKFCFSIPMFSFDALDNILHARNYVLTSVLLCCSGNNLAIQILMFVSRFENCVFPSACLLSLLFIFVCACFVRVSFSYLYFCCSPLSIMIVIAVAFVLSIPSFVFICLSSSPITTLFFCCPQHT